MSEFRPFLDREARRVHADPGALEAVLRRAERRRTWRRAAAGAVALAIAGGSLGLAYAAFRPDREARPAREPVPGPTPIPQAMPGPSVLVTSASATEGAAEFAAAILTAAGSPPEVVDISYRDSAGAEDAEEAQGTTIFCHPTVEGLAVTLRDRFFPGADLQGRIDPDTIVVAVGDDFIRDNGTMFENFMTVRSFMTRRAEGNGAEAFLSDDAAREFAEGTNGLSLYGYTEGARFWVAALHPGEDDTAVAEVRIVAHGTGSERLTVGDRDPRDGVPEILAAEIGVLPGPALPEVEAFVEGFLDARRLRSGAGAYLGEDARTAYASHEGGLDLLGYAAGPGPVDARIVAYDKLSPDRHRVAVRFDAAGEDSPVVWETLLIGWLGADQFVVLDAERGLARESDSPPPEDPEQAVAAFVLEELDAPYVGTCPEGFGPDGSVPQGICSLRFETGEDRAVYRVGPPFSEWLGEVELARDDTGMWTVTRYEPFPPPGE
jgi:hypothetical protein